MPLVTPTPIGTLSPVPSTASPSDFDAKANAFLGGLPTFRTQTNQIAADTNTNAAYAQDMANTAIAQASTATTQAASAAVSATSAATAAGAAVWSGATSYAQGACCWSPVDYTTYRKITAGSSTTTEPTVTPGTWTPIVPLPHLALISLGII